MNINKNYFHFLKVSIIIIIILCLFMIGLFCHKTPFNRISMRVVTFAHPKIQINDRTPPLLNHEKRSDGDP